MTSPVIYKQPSQSKNATLDCSVRLATGVTLQSITSTTVTPSGLVAGSVVLANNNTAISVQLSSGTAGIVYTISFAVVLSNGLLDTIDLTVNVAEVTTRRGLPFKPSDFILEPGRRYLKGIVPDLAPESDSPLGISQWDLTSAEDYAWDMLLSRLVTWYDVSAFSTDTPIPLRQIWELIASAYVHAMASQRKNVEDTQAISTQEKWMTAGDKMIQNLTDPVREGERMQLISPVTGSIIYKRSKGSIPMVTNVRGVEFFPTSNSALSAWGDAPHGSVQDFITYHSLVSK